MRGTRSHPSGRRFTRLTGVSAVVAALAVFATACGGGGDGPTSGAGSQVPAQQKNQALYDKLPKEVQQAGTVKIGTEALYPPFESFAEDN
jgi:polar amino acid transport system substrate-binding protein